MRGLGWICAATLLGASASTAWAGAITDGSAATPIQGIQVTARREASPNQWQGVAEFTDEATGIEGRVVDAETGQPLDGIQVCAREADGEESSRCSYTSTDGRYLVGGMPSGEYKVAFSPERDGDDEEAPEVEDGYFSQYYEDALTRAAALVLPLTAPSITTGIDAGLTSKHPPVGKFPKAGPDIRPPRPNTVILPLGTKVVRRSVTFRFATKAPGSWFECRMDRRPYAHCGSPRTYRHLRPGRHVFEVRAMTWQGDADPTPARYKFKVKLRPRGR